MTCCSTSSTSWRCWSWTTSWRQRRCRRTCRTPRGPRPRRARREGRAPVAAPAASGRRTRVRGRAGRRAGRRCEAAAGPSVPWSSEVWFSFMRTTVTSAAVDGLCTCCALPVTFTPGPLPPARCSRPATIRARHGGRRAGRPGGAQDRAADGVELQREPRRRILLHRAAHALGDPAQERRDAVSVDCHALGGRSIGDLAHHRHDVVPSGVTHRTERRRSSGGEQGQGREHGQLVPEDLALVLPNGHVRARRRTARPPAPRRVRDRPPRRPARRWRTASDAR